MGQFFPLVNFTWVPNISSKAVKTGMPRDSGRNAYLSGGAGVVFTRSAVETLASCIMDSSSSKVQLLLSENFHTGEDHWSSRLFYTCGVTLVRSNRMYQFGRVDKKKVPMTLSIHRVAGDGRRNYKHPSVYEQMIAKQ